MAKYGRKNILLLGLFTSAFSALIFGVASYLEDSQKFYIMSAVARTVLGFGEGMCLTCVPAIIALEFEKSKQNDYMGYFTMASGLGLCIGPLSGAIIYGWIGYSGTFYFFFCILSISTIFCFIYVPNHLNKSNE